MLFNSSEFIIFFPLVVVTTFLLPHKLRWIFLLGASYYFYMAWEPVYALLIIATTLIDYLAGLLLGKSSDKRKRKLILYISLSANLGVLFFFKYFNLFSSSLDSLFQHLSIHIDLPGTTVLLPIGISFYTFQSMSYTIDVYRGKQEPQKHPGIFALYVVFFPQLVAGPIERAKNLIHQLTQKHDYDYKRISDGLKLMAWGMFKKVVIADRLASLVDTVYSEPSEFKGPVLLTATLFFAFQIYCDFSGYSDIAIGAAQVLGIKLMQNFNRPYFSESIPEFWRRWHISLSTWFRDYLYITLGGNRVSINRWYFNIFIVFLLSGLWHGASWTFVIWGMYHGILMLLTSILPKYIPGLARLNRMSSVMKFIKILLTFSLVNIGWIIFRADNMSDFQYIMIHLFSGWENYSDMITLKSLPSRIGITHTQLVVSWGCILFLLIIQLLQRSGSVRERIDSRPFYVRWALYYALILTILFLGVFNENQFIYFQF